MDVQAGSGYEDPERNSSNRLNSVQFKKGKNKAFYPYATHRCKLGDGAGVVPDHAFGLAVRFDLIRTSVQRSGSPATDYKAAPVV